MSGTVVTGEDDMGSGVWISGMSGTGEDILSNGMGLSGMWNSKKNTVGIRIRRSRTWGSGENAPDSRMRINGKWGSQEGCSGQQAEHEQDAGLSPGRGSRTPAWGCSCSGHQPVTGSERSQLRYHLSHRHPQPCKARAAPSSPWHSRTPNIPKPWHCRPLTFQHAPV